MTQILRIIDMAIRNATFTRYIVIGLISNVTMYFVYLIITYQGVESKSAMTGLYIIGALVGYVGNRKWTFSHRGRAAQTIVRYVMAYFTAYVFNFIVLYTLVDHIGYAHQWVQALSIIVGSGFLFVILKCYVFKEYIEKTL